MRRYIVLLAILLFVAPVASASAASIWWNGVDGSSSSWNVTGNWSTVSNATSPFTATVPGASDNVFFNISTVNSNQTVNLNSNQSVNGLTFSSTGTTTIANGTGSDLLTIGGGGITVNPGAGAVTINSSSAALTSSQTWSVAPFDMLTVPAVVFASSAVTVTKTGAGQANVTNSSQATAVVPSNLTFDVEQGRLLIGQGAGIPANMGFAMNGGSYFNAYGQWSNAQNANSTYVISIGTAGAQWEVPRGSANFSLNGTAPYGYSGGSSGNPITVIKTGYGPMYFGQNGSNQNSKINAYGNTYCNVFATGGIYELPQDNPANTAGARSTLVYNTQLIGGGLWIYSSSQMAAGTGSKIRVVNSAASLATIEGPVDGSGLSGGVFSPANMQNEITTDSSGVVVLPNTADTDNWNMALIGNGKMFLSAQSTGYNNNTFQGTLSPCSDNTYRLGGNTSLILSNQLETSNNGGISLQNATLAAGNNLIVGSGLAGSYGSVWLRQNSSAFNGTVTINADTITALPQYNRMILSLTASGALPNASSFAIGPAAEILVDNSNGVNASNRLNSAAPITMDDASKLVLASSSGGASTQSIGSVTAIGFATLSVEPNGGVGPVLSGSNVSVQGGGTVVFESGNNKGTSGTLGTATGGDILLSNLNGSPITSNVTFMGGAYVAGNAIDPSGNSKNFYTWAKYNTTTGVAAFSSSDYFANSNTPSLWTNSGTDNINLTTNSLALASSQSINSLRFDVNVSAFSLGSFQMNVAAMMSGSSSVTISNGTLSSSSPTLYIHNNEGMTINSQLSGNFNLAITEDEPGQNNSFVLGNAANNFVGNIYVNDGEISYINDNRWGPTSNPMSLNGVIMLVGTNVATTVNRQINILGGGAILDQVSGSNTGAMIFAGQVSGSGSITIYQSQAVTFSNSNNNFTGVVTVQAPNSNNTTASTILRTGAANVLGNNAAYVVQSTSLLDLTNNGANAGYSQAIGSLEDAGNVNLGSATLTVGGNNQPAVYTGDIYGTGGVTKSGTGLWIIGNVQNYSGATNVNGGTLQLYTDGGAYDGLHNAGNLAKSGTISIASGAVLDVSAYNNLSPQFTVGAASTNNQLLTGGGTVAGNLTLGSLGTIDAGATTITGSFTLAGGSVLNSSGTATVTSPGYIMQSGSAAAALTGASARLVKSTTGTATLSGNNTYGGGTTVNAGTLLVAQTGSLPGYLSSGSVSVSSGAILGLAVGGTGQFQASDVTAILGNVTFSPSGYLGFNATGASGVYTVADNLTNTNLGIAKIGGGAVVLTGTNSYTGGTIVSGGTLQLGGSSALGPGALAANGGLLDLHGQSVTVTSFSGAAGVVTNLNSSGATLTVNQSGATNFGGSLADGTHPVGLHLSAGSLTLSGSSNYSGGTTVNSGLLKINNASALGLSDLALTGGTLDVNGNTASVKALAGSGTIGNGAAGSSSPGMLAVGNGGTFYGTINDGINGGGSTTALSINGGTLALNATSPYSGGTTITAGGLMLANGASLSGTGAVTLHGGVLANSGTSAIAGLITAGSGSHAIVPGGYGQFGQLNVAGLTLNGNSTLNFDLSSSHSDLIVDSGSLAISSGTVNLQVTGSLGNGIYPLINFGSTTLADTSGFSLSPISGTLNGYGLVLDTVDSQQQLDLVIGAFATSTSYSLAASAGAALLHTGGTTSVQTTVTNSGIGSADVLAYAGLGASATGTVSGATGGGTLALGASASNSQTFTATTAGNIMITPIISGGTNASLLTLASSGSVTSATISVFSGNARWTGSASNSWGSGASGNWTDANNSGVAAAPGGWGYNDTALFDNTGGTKTVALNGASPVLSALTFNTTTFGYTLQQGSGGTLTLNNSGSGATITVLSGSQSITAPILLEDALTVSPSNSSTLNISSNITESPSGKSLTLNGDGTLILSGTNSFMGGTTVLDGTLIVESSAGLADGSSLTVGSPAMFAGLIPAGNNASAEVVAITPVPEPGTLALVSIAAAAGWFVRRRCRR